MPYTTPKFTALARRRSSGVTSSSATWNTLAAVAVWKSVPDRNDSRMASSPEICASRRSSIWE